MSFSFCLIGKNEAHRLDKCLAPLKATGMEIIFLDTGSTDDTVSIAKKYTSNVHFFKWCNDFSAARNFACGKASNNYVLFIDCDEYLEQIDVKKIKQLISMYPRSIGRIRRRNQCHSGSTTTIFIDLVERLYHRDYYHYEGRIHEQVTPTKGQIPTGYELPLTVFHDGYIGTQEELTEKAQRNITLLLEDLKENPSDPYTYYQLGQAYDLMQDYEKSYENYSKACALPMDNSLEYVQLMLCSYGYSMIYTGRSTEAAALKEKYPLCYEDADFVTMLGSAFLESKQILKAMAEFKHALTLDKFHTEGANSFIPCHNLACIYEALGNETAALHYYSLAENYPASLQRKEALLLRLKDKDTRNIKHASVLIYCNNDAAYLPALFASYENQTFGIQHLEFIFIDSASQDNTMALLTEFEQKYPESVILIPFPEPISKSEAYAMALPYATADYVSFLSAGNYPSPDCFRHLTVAGNTYGADILACNDSQEYPEFHIKFESTQQKQSVLTAGILQMSLTGKMFRRERLLRSGLSFARHTISEEELTLLLLLSGESLYFYGVKYMSDKPAVIMFQGVNPTLDYLSEAYKNALESCGQPVFMFQMKDFENSAKKLFSHGKENLRAALAMNNIGFSMEKNDGSDLWQEWNIPAYNILVDHPMYYFDTLDNPPKGGCVLCADENHVAYAKKFYPSVAKAGFLPTGGTYTLPFASLPGFEKRTIDILLLGNYKHHEEIVLDNTANALLAELKKHPHKTLEDAVTELYFSEIAEAKSLSTNNPMASGNHNSGNHASSITELKLFIEKYRFLETNLCSEYRKQAMLLLLDAGFTIEAYGNGWENTECTNFENFHLHPPVSAKKGLDLMQNSKIVFNNMAWFKKGGSERIFNATLQGAVVLSDSSEYLDTIFQNQESILFYSLEHMENIPSMVSDLLKHPEDAERIRQNAYINTFSGHTWLHRAHKLLTLMHL